MFPKCHSSWCPHCICPICSVFADTQTHTSQPTSAPPRLTALPLPTRTGISRIAHTLTPLATLHTHADTSLPGVHITPHRSQVLTHTCTCRPAPTRPHWLRSQEVALALPSSRARPPPVLASRTSPLSPGDQRRAWPDSLHLNNLPSPASPTPATPMLGILASISKRSKQTSCTQNSLYGGWGSLGTQGA